MEGPLSDEEKAALLEVRQRGWREGLVRHAENLDTQRYHAKQLRRLRALFDNPKLHGKI